MKESDKPYPGLRGKASGVKGVDDRLYYMTGNGRIAATFYRGNIYEIFGPPYSSPSLFSSYFENEIECEDPVRTERAPVWTVSLKDQDGNCGSVTDFVDPEHPALFRSFEWNEKAPIKYLLKLKNGAFEYIIPHTEPGTLLLKTKCGNYVYNDYPLPFPQFFILSARGNASFTVCDNETIEIIISGKSLIVLNGGPDYPDACNNYKIIRDIPEDEVLRRLNDSWSEVFSRVTCLKEIPEPLPRRDELIRAVEDAVICILVQQGKEGGVLAGHAYHLGYVRDQFGVSEGLISLGLVKEAGNILNFYIDTFRKQGKILNAQGLGVNGLFHFAENDKVEITGYLLLQFFRYAEVSGDNKILYDNVDFLKWLYKCQAEELQDEELPFNGDETYIACGLLSRDAVSDGSAEATLLFIRSGERLASYLESRGENTVEIRKTLSSVKSHFTAKFIRDGKYCINDPDRRAVLPPFRYGVCMGCGSFGWSGLTPERSYLCTHCLSNGVKRYKKDIRLSLPSSLLMPAYLGADLPEVHQSIINEVERLTGLIVNEGAAYSVPEAKLNVGYDYGLLLYNILHYGLDGAETVYGKVLDLRDGVGVFSERYIEHYPDGTRFRPWETAINIDAMLKFARSYK